MAMIKTREKKVICPWCGAAQEYDMYDPPRNGRDICTECGETYRIEVTCNVIYSTERTCHDE
jgi:uncharacterized Zn-finger protein